MREPGDRRRYDAEEPYRTGHPLLPEQQLFAARLWAKPLPEEALLHNILIPCGLGKYGAEPRSAPNREILISRPVLAAYVFERQEDTGIRKILRPDAKFRDALLGSRRCPRGKRIDMAVLLRQYSTKGGIERA